MTGYEDGGSEKGRKVDELVADYLNRLAMGEVPDRQAWLTQHADVATELSEFLSDYDNFGCSSKVRREESSVAQTEAMQRAFVATGQRIGPYKLIRPVGEGGMGTVYLAQQDRPVKRIVALKVIKAGMDSRQVIARFEAERQALAMMDHPNIAKVLDAGATSGGLPYFVMEFVKGIPITQYCDQEHLSPRERLELFIPVCQAVQHAHQKGVIHRDLKPSNVLVGLYDGQPIPKVIDFGLAKATAHSLSEASMYTEIGQMIGTLEYMSPEQSNLDNLDIDTRSDIYSLGVMLYELLTGSPPFSSQELRKAGYDEIRRIIREVDPPKPSTRLSGADNLPSIAANRKLEPLRLTRVVTGDLDWIVMKCLEKNRGRRYETATGLGTDLQRYLHSEPVSASPPSSVYRLRKFVRRNAGAVVAAAAILLALVGGAIGTTIGLYRESQQRRVAQQMAVLAEDQAAVAEGVSQFQSEMLAAADPGRLLGDKVTVLQAIMAAIDVLDAGKLKNQPRVEATVRLTIGTTMQSLGRFTEADAQLSKSLQIFRQVLPSGDTQIADCLSASGLLSLDASKLLQAEQQFQEALDIDSATVPVIEKNIARSLSNLALLRKEQGKLVEAESMFGQALEIAKRNYPADDPAIALAIHNLGSLLQLIPTASKRLEAEGLLREVLAMRQRILPADHLDISASLNNLAIVLRVQGKFSESEVYQERALAMNRRILPDRHPEIATCLNNLALLQREQGNLEAAEKNYRECLDILISIFPDGHLHTATVLEDLARVLDFSKQNAEAEPLYRESLSIRRRLRPAGHSQIAQSLNNLALNLDIQEKLDEAEKLYNESLDLKRQIPASEFADLPVALNNLGHFYNKRGKPESAEPLFRESLTRLAADNTPEQWKFGLTRLGLARSLATLDRLTEAESEFLLAESQLREAPAGYKRDYFRCIQALIDIYERSGKSDSARPWQAKLDEMQSAMTMQQG